MRLNKFLAKSGIASRRRSDELIRMAMATVNNEIILDPAYNVQESDIIKFDGKLLILLHQLSQFNPYLKYSPASSAQSIDNLNLTFLKFSIFSNLSEPLLT